MARRNNIATVFDILVREGKLLPHQAYGLIGRLQQESGQGLNTLAHGDKSIEGGGSRGIGQWNRDRLRNLKKFGGENWTDPAVQARFIIHEGQGPESQAWNMIKSARNVEEAATGAMAYERPQGFTWKNPAGGHGYSNTIKNARALAGGGVGGITLTSVPDGPKGEEMYTPIDSGTSLSADGVSDTPTPESESQGWADKLKSIFAEGGEGEEDEGSDATNLLGAITGDTKDKENRQQDTSIQSILPAMEGADMQRMQTAQALMSQIMQKKRQRGLSLTGVPSNAF